MWFSKGCGPIRHILRLRSKSSSRRGNIGDEWRGLTSVSNPLLAINPRGYRHAYRPRFSRDSAIVEFRPNWVGLSVFRSNDCRGRDHHLDLYTHTSCEVDSHAFRG